MKLPSTRKWSAGDQADASVFNEVSTALDFLANPPSTWVVASGATHALAVPGSTFTTVNLTASLIDTEVAAGYSAMWTSANPSRVYAQTPGWYEVEANVQWLSVNDSARRLLMLVFTGSDGVARSKARTDVASIGTMIQRLSYPLFMNAGEYVEMKVFTGGAATSLLADPGSNYLRNGIRMRWFSL